MRKYFFVVFSLLLSALSCALVVNVNVASADDEQVASLTISTWQYATLEPIIANSPEQTILSGHITFYGVAELDTAVDWSHMHLHAYNDLALNVWWELYDVDTGTYDVAIVDLVDLSKMSDGYGQIQTEIIVGTDYYYIYDTEPSEPSDPYVTHIEPSDWGRLLSFANYNDPIIITNLSNNAPISEIEILIDIYFYNIAVTYPMILPFDNLGDWSFYEYELDVELYDSYIPDIPIPTDPDTGAWWSWIGTFIASIASGFLGIEIYPNLSVGKLVAVPFVLILVAWIIGLIRGRTVRGDDDDD